jgi:hypothetical protein
MEQGDFIRVKPEHSERYKITNSKMTRGVVIKIESSNAIKVKVVEHEDTNNIGQIFEVESYRFEVIGHLKPFNRDEVLELLKNGCKKAILDYDLSNADLTYIDLSNANLNGANLDSANLDFSCLPLRCGGLKWHIDKRIACQLTYHLCSMQCDDEEFIRLRNLLLPFANQFHRVAECGKLTPIDTGE